MFKEDVTELEYEINSVQKDSLETIVNDRDFRKFMPSAQCLLWNECYCSGIHVSAFLLKRILVVNSENTEIECRFINWQIRVAVTKYVVNYDKLAEELLFQVSHLIP